MTLLVRLAVKFRFAGITFGHLNREFNLALPAYPARLLEFNERGVGLRIETTTGDGRRVTDDDPSNRTHPHLTSS